MHAVVPQLLLLSAAIAFFAVRRHRRGESSEHYLVYTSPKVLVLRAPFRRSRASVARSTGGVGPPVPPADPIPSKHVQRCNAAPRGALLGVGGRGRSSEGGPSSVAPDRGIRPSPRTMGAFGAELETGTPTAPWIPLPQSHRALPQRSWTILRLDPSWLHFGCILRRLGHRKRKRPSRNRPRRL